MKRFLLLLLMLFARDAKGEVLTYDKFGTVTIYRPAQQDPKAVAIFISGDGGWNRSAISMAEASAELGALVIGVDILKYQKTMDAASGICSYPAADFEALSKYVQKKLSLTRYQPPILAGFSSGATLVYALLAQAPAGTFRSGLSLGFCPDMKVHKPLCKGSSLEITKQSSGKWFDVLPSKDFRTPWTILQGKEDKVCAPHYAIDYKKIMPNIRTVMLDRVGHGFLVQKNWLPQFKTEMNALVSSTGESGQNLIEDLPIIEISTTHQNPIGVAILMTGDGGWAGIDREVARSLSRNGISVIAIDSLKYFWYPKTPEEVTQTIHLLIQKYTAQFKHNRVMLVGYSFGADILPFVYNRLPHESKNLVQLTALLAPDESINFEFHLTDWVKYSVGKYKVIPEIEQMEGIPILCIAGKDDINASCHKLSPEVIKLILPGGHHFGGEYDNISSAILHHFATAPKLKLQHQQDS